MHVQATRNKDNYSTAQTSVNLIVHLPSNKTKYNNEIKPLNHI